MRPLPVLIAGGGVAAVEAALALRAFAGDRVQVTVTAPGPDLVRRQESVDTPFGGGPAPRLGLERLAALGVGLRRDAIAAIDTERSVAHTSDGVALPYDRLLVAMGARPLETLPGAVHFRGPLSAGRVEGCVATARGGGDPLTFVVPAMVSWPLPLYELALQAAAALAPYPAAAGVRIVTPERRPLDMFGAHVSDAVARLLQAAGVHVVTAARAQSVIEGHLVTDTGAFLAVGPVVTLPVLAGPALPGLPHDVHGFIPTDVHGRVPGAPHVFAAGDVTTAPIKQGGLAAQAADAVAAAIAAEVGAPIPSVPEPVLRAELRTADAPLYLRAWPETDRPGEVSPTPLWDPSGKLAGRFLSAFIATGEPQRELVDVPARVAVSSVHAER